MKSFVIALLSVFIIGTSWAQEFHHLDDEASATKKAVSAQKGDQSQEKTPIESTNNSLTITPVEGCFTRLSKDDVSDIKMNYEKPYQECLRRVRANEAKKNSINLIDQKAPAKEDKKEDKKNEENSKNPPRETQNN